MSRQTYLHRSNATTGRQDLIPMMAEVIPSQKRPIIGVERQGRHRKSPDYLYSLDCTVKELSESPNPVLQICKPAAEQDPAKQAKPGSSTKTEAPGFGASVMSGDIRPAPICEHR